MLSKILKVELTLLNLGGELFGVFFLNNFGRFFNQRNNVTHSKNSRGNPLRMENFKRIEFLTSAQ